MLFYHFNHMPDPLAWILWRSFLKINWKETKIHAVENGLSSPKLCCGTTSWRAIPSVSKILSNVDIYKQLHSMWKAEEIQIMKSAFILQTGVKSNAVLQKAIQCTYLFTAVTVGLPTADS